MWPNILLNWKKSLIYVVSIYFIYDYFDVSLKICVEHLLILVLVMKPMFVGFLIPVQMHVKHLSIQDVMVTEIILKGYKTVSKHVVYNFSILINTLCTIFKALQCKSNSEQTPCVNDPCNEQSCSRFEDAVCVTKSCGECTAHFYNSTGFEVTSLCNCKDIIIWFYEL